MQSLCLKVDGGPWSWAVRMESVDSYLNVQMQIRLFTGCLVCCVHQIQAAETIYNWDLPQPHSLHSCWKDNCELCTSIGWAAWPDHDDYYFLMAISPSLACPHLRNHKLLITFSVTITGVWMPLKTPSLNHVSATHFVGILFHCTAEGKEGKAVQVTRWSAKSG